MRISIITPVFNRAHLIESCIESVARQSFSDYEHIIVDDASSDGTNEIIDKYSEVSTVIKITLPENKGVNHARNIGISKAKGEYILFLDSDDELAKSALADIAENILNYPGYSHYLFLIAYRAGNFEKETRRILYSEWVEGKIQGDFTHVVKAALLRENLFFEHFRAFEILNWLRIYKQAGASLLVPVVTTMVRQDQSDSLTNSLRLSTPQSISTRFEYLKMFLQLHGDDLCRYAAYRYERLIRELILFGIADGKKAYLKSDVVKRLSTPKNMVARLGIIFIPGVLLKNMIIRYSVFKNR